eukprot:3392758-Prymnesium_polylepis.1
MGGAAGTSTEISNLGSFWTFWPNPGSTDLPCVLLPRGPLALQRTFVMHGRLCVVGRAQACKAYSCMGIRHSGGAA